MLRDDGCIPSSQANDDSLKKAMIWRDRLVRLDFFQEMEANASPFLLLGLCNSALRAAGAQADKDRAP